MKGIFNLEKGIFHTIKQLILNPGIVITEYLNGKTKAYYNPLKFLFLMAAISAFFAIISNTYDNSIELTHDISG